MGREPDGQAGGDSEPKRRGRKAASATVAKQIDNFNLNGQRLGRKGRNTRERIIAAAQSLLSGPRSTQITLSAVAREAELKMTSLYVYFKDLTELLLATLEPVMETAEAAYLSLVRERWPDEALNACCLRFLNAYLAFWREHSFLLHLRNSMADQYDERMMRQRVDAARPLITMLVRQMDGDPTIIDSPALSMATVLLTGVERVVTIVTDTTLVSFFDGSMTEQLALRRIEAEAKLMELGIRELRRHAANGAAGG
ncbi:TetR/AcrR family transcriptional regulator [Nitrospirillum iridis]|uniref:AcrR family transcriptional regulator n=1 Tax=Nitrospirillum iridis TaxID=765888 RepID=A0A7X0B346_9PROT|nr:TetR/AcrR family transcriptional regulator [Nitrospirillum iridis]MBB6253344.1 AcrR family transcriptional regulator [Nitrospirillum iridis]